MKSKDTHRKTKKISTKTTKIPTKIQMKSSRVFSDTHYNSTDGMLTTVWGPSMWHYLHTMSFNYPVKPSMQQKLYYRKFMLDLKNVLPCGKCRSNLVNNYKKHPLQMRDMKSRETFSLYVYELHELINTMLDKKSGLSFQDVKERYEHFRARCKLPYNEMKTRKIKKSGKGIENGCTEPIYGEKSKCILHIIPAKTKCETMQIDEQCLQKRADETDM